MRGFVQVEIPSEAFRFSGQSTLEAWTLQDVFERVGWSAYDRWLSDEIRLCLLRVRDLADAFPAWQRRAPTGRPPIDERTHLIATMVRQFFQFTFRQTESFLHVLCEFFRLPRVPDHNTLSEKNRSGRFARVLRRFHRFVLASLPRRESVVATDATGYSNRKQPWRETDYGFRATQDWLKVHTAVEIPTLLILNSAITPGHFHDSRRFERVWQELPENIRPVRSLADGAYANEKCLRAAQARGATPLHGIREDARHVRQPETAYQRLVNFATHWPNRFRELTKQRTLIETTFNCAKQRFGHRLRCRAKIARHNEIRAKEIAHNLRMILMREQVGSN